MPACKESIEYKRAREATMGMFRAILDRSGLSQTTLEDVLGVPSDRGRRFGRYLAGAQVPSQGQLLKYAKFAWKRGFLSANELRELGMCDIANDRPVTEVLKARTKAIAKYFHGVENMLDGNLPLPVYTPRGPVNRPPGEADDPAAIFKKWVAQIEAFGGVVTKTEWVPFMWQEAVSDFDLEQWHTSREDADREQGISVHSTTPLPAWHPSSVRKLNLWIGGREFSQYANSIVKSWWMYPADDDGEPLVSGDDFSEFVAEAKCLANKAIARASTK